MSDKELVASAIEIANKHMEHGGDENDMFKEIIALCNKAFLQRGEKVVFDLAIGIDLGNDVIEALQDEFNE